MKRKFLVLFLIVLLSGIGIFALEKNYSVITEFKYVDIATSKAFDNCLQNVCSDPNLYYFEDISGVKAYTQIETVKPIISVLGPATFSFRDGDASFETMCRIADAVWTENDASRDGVTDCCEIRKSLGLTGAGEPCLI